MSSPQHFLIPLGDRVLYTAPLNGFVALMNPSAARLLRDSGLQAAEGLFGRTADSLSIRAPAPAPSTGDILPTFLGLITTRGCNIACRYCDFRLAEDCGQAMRPSLAVQAINWYADAVAKNGGKTLDVHFFGGEPLLVPRVVETAVHRTRCLAAELGLDATFEAATNGVLSPVMREFVADYFTTVVLSMDGPASVHDFNRPALNGHPTFDSVAETAHYLSDSPAHLCIRTCATAASYRELPKTCAWMCETFAPDSIDFETLTEGPAAVGAGMSPPPPIPFARALIESFRVAIDHGVIPVYAAASAATPRVSFCPVGTDAVIVSPDGRLGSCYLPASAWRKRGLDLDFGIADYAGIRIDAQALERVRATPMGKARCHRCFCRFSCAGGCHVNHTYPAAELGLSDYCRQTRVVTACLYLEEMGLSAVTDAILVDAEATRMLAEGCNDEVLEWT